MKLKVVALLLATHFGVAVLGFMLGIYTLPIISAPASPSKTELTQLSSNALYTTEFIKALKDSDVLHWGEGKVSISNNNVSFVGSLAPGPAYQLYFSPTFVETEADFKRLKSTMVSVGDIRTFENFVVPLQAEIELEKFNTVIVWCEVFEQFITAAQYR